MESAENGFKRHHLIPFSQKIPRAVAASLTSREEKNHPLFEKKKSVSLSNSCTFHICKQWNSSEKENEHTISAKNPSECTICILFSKIFSGRSPDPPPPHHQSCKGVFPNAPTSPYCSEVGLQPPPTVDQVSRSIFDNAMYIFNTILLKIQLNLIEFKRLYLHSRLHHFAPFFQNFLGGGPPNPHQREGTPLPYPPHSALRASRTPPQIYFWIRHWNCW